MDSYLLSVACKNAIIDYLRENKEIQDETIRLSIKDIYVVWSVKALQNNKYLLSTTLPDGLYYEMTYNGDKEELYVDVYKKWKNYVIKKEDFNYVVEDYYDI